MFFGGTYFKSAFDINSDIVRMAELKLKGVEFDTIVGTGVSGSVVVPLIAGHLGKDYAIVRKERSPHDSGLVVGNVGHKWIFVDDFVSSGATLTRVKSAMLSLQCGMYVEDNSAWGQTWKEVTYPTEYVGTFEYVYNNFQKPGTEVKENESLNVV
jgi:hypoxanthine phosphoribosyltransferase